MHNKKREVVITGMGSVSSIGFNNINILKKLKTNSTGYIENDCFRVQPDILEKVNNVYNTGERSIDFAAFSFINSLEDAKLTVKDIPDNSFLSFSSSKGGLSSLYNAATSNEKLLTNFNNYLAVSPLNNICSIIGKNIPASNVISACSTGLYSIVQAYNAIIQGAEFSIAGTTESSIIPIVVEAFTNMKVVTKDKCRPFDIDRSGFQIGEGAGCLILEEKKRAIKRNARIYGKISGYGQFTDPTHMTGLDPSGEQIEKAILKSINEDASIDWVNAHGTATRLNDEAESNAIIRTLGNSVNVNSFKPFIGHLLGASSVVEIVLSILCMTENFIPANINTKHVEYDVNVADETIKKPLNRILKLSHGFGGHIGSIVIEKL